MSKKKHCPVPGCHHHSSWVDRHMRMKIQQGDVIHVEYRDKYYKYVCPVCSKKLKSQHALVNHFKQLNDNKHQEFKKDQEQKVVGYFDEGLSVPDIIQQYDIVLYNYADGIYKVLHEVFTRNRIQQQGRKVTGQKNKERMLEDPQAYFDRFLTCRTQGSKPQRRCYRLIKGILLDYEVKHEDEEVFPGKSIDITIPELKVAIEWQGPPHRRPIFGEKSLKNLQKSDKAKRTYFKKLGWQLIEVIDDNSSASEGFIREQVDLILEQIK